MTSDDETNHQLLSDLLTTSTVRLERGSIFDTLPSPLVGQLGWDRVEGMLYGLCIGDALGNTTKGQLPSERQARRGEILYYLPNKEAGGQPIGLPSHNSQLALWTLEQLLTDNGLIPEHLGVRFSQDHIYGIDSTMRAFLACYKKRTLGAPWHSCGQPSAGNGALTRVAPILIPHVMRGTTALWADVALAAMLTHNHPTSTAACVAFVAMLWDLLAMDAPPPSMWWVERYVTVARDLEGETRLRPRGGAYVGYEGPLWRFVTERVPEAIERGLSTRTACDAWYSGAYLLETVPSVLYILAQHGHDPETALIRAVNDTKDNDTIAAIVGAAVGALHGKAALPARWLAGLLGRSTEDDDGQLDRLLAAAREHWWREPDPGGASTATVAAPEAVTAVRRRLAGVIVREHRSHGGVTVWPLLAAPEGPVHLPLAPALVAGVAAVSEQAEASVLELILENRGLAPVLIIDGEEVVGGWQNRAATSTALIGAGRQVTLPVHCVEQGRWDNSRQDFGAGEVLPSRLRERVKRGVQTNLRTGSRHADQGEVWAEVQSHLTNLGTNSETEALHDAYQSQAPRLDEYDRSLPADPGACGIAVAVGGQLTALELFNQPATAALYWPRLVRAAALEAVATGATRATPVTKTIGTLLELAMNAAATAGPGLDRGIEVQLTASGLTGSALLDNEIVVHLAILTAIREAGSDKIDLQLYVEDDAGYLAWLANHPDGYVLNVPRSGKTVMPVLHRATCYTITGVPARGSTWTGPYVKVCATRSQALEVWATQAEHEGVHRCQRCSP